ncbi:hypothetical protein EOA23_29660, partial [Mesorhizobium sp. M2A.F.Ca.ET.042.01.1.1]|uniref:hypothetical protein n=1 Tax=Mesorhizobium sp. M2A.F.Ca.ET.042.01.1.1 TaxID=2496745 RepID=UPI000FD2CEB4
MEKRKIESDTGGGPKTKVTGALQKAARAAPKKREDYSYLTFGVGCFHFASLRPENELTLEKYLQDLKDYLLSDKLISNFEVETGNVASFFAEKRPKEITEDIYDSEIIYPY